MKGKKRELTEREVKWLQNHFPNTKNAELAEHLGISESALHRYARQYGLKKTRQFMHKCQAATTAAAKRSHLMNGTYPPKGYIIPRSWEFRFRPGEKPVDRIGKRREKKRIEKSQASLAATRKLEHARALFGLERKTKLKVIAQPRWFALQRNYLRRLGYVVPRGSMVAYYTDLTRRSKDYETRTRDTTPRYAPFRFQPLEEPSLFTEEKHTANFAHPLSPSP